MSLRTFLRDLFGLDQPPTGLRNKPGGLAWIRVPNGTDDGSEVLHGRIVTTVSADADGFWSVAPEQSFVLTKPIVDPCGVRGPRGATAIAEGIPDDCLEPIRDAGLSRAEVARLYEPGPRITKKEHAC